MKWTEAYSLLEGKQHEQVGMIAIAWWKAAESGNSALMSNLLCNMLHPTGVCHALDAAGVAVPPEALAGMVPNVQVQATGNSEAVERSPATKGCATRGDE